MEPVLIFLYDVRMACSCCDIRKVFIKIGARPSQQRSRNSCKCRRQNHAGTCALFDNQSCKNSTTRQQKFNISTGEDTNSQTLSCGAERRNCALSFFKEMVQVSSVQRRPHHISLARICTFFLSLTRVTNSDIANVYIIVNILFTCFGVCINKRC